MRNPLVPLTLLVLGLASLPLAKLAATSAERDAVARAASPGYTVVAPLGSNTTLLVDGEGRVVHRWESDAPPGNSVELLASGQLLRTERLGTNPVFGGGGEGGRVRELDWDGTVTWEYVLSDERHLQHHVVEPLPSGNVLVLAWERKSAAEALAAGRDPALLPAGELWSEALFEIEPLRPVGGRVVWEWHAWDHLVQDRDSALPNHGRPSDHPGRIDVNAAPDAPARSSREAAQELRRLRALGYAGGDEEDEEVAEEAGDAAGDAAGEPGAARRDPGFGADWLHANAVGYDPVHDRIALSIHNLSEVWVIDHSTTSQEAAGPRGDLLWRWGNPRVWGGGDAGDRQLMGQHDVQWIAEGLPGAGHLLLFDNGSSREDRAWSRVVELVVSTDATGAFPREPGGAFGPEGPAWQARLPRELFSERISGAQRLPNGRTLVCSGERGTVVELDEEGEVVWRYQVPATGGGARRDSGGPPERDGRRRRPEREGPERGGPEGRRGPPPREGGAPGEGRRGPRLGGPPGGPGGPGGRGVFRAQRVPPDFPGLGTLSEPEEPSAPAPGTSHDPLTGDSAPSPVDAGGSR